MSSFPISPAAINQRQRTAVNKTIQNVKCVHKGETQYRLWYYAKPEPPSHPTTNKGHTLFRSFTLDAVEVAWKRPNENNMQGEAFKNMQVSMVCGQICHTTKVIMVTVPSGEPGRLRIASASGVREYPRREVLGGCFLTKAVPCRRCG